MARKQFNIRLPEITMKQIMELVDMLPAESQSHVVMIAVSRLHQELKAAKAKEVEPEKKKRW